MATEDELVIQLDDGKNGNIMFPPVQTFYRGTWRRENLPPGATSETGLLACPTIPGFLICLSFAEHRGRILDPLGFESNRQLLTSINNVIGSGPGGLQNYAAEPPKIVENLNDNQIASWHYHMRRLVGVGFAKVDRGSFRDKLKGVARVDYFDSNPFGPKTEPEMEAYRMGKFRSPMDTPLAAGTAE